MTIWSENAGRFASRPEDAQAQAAAIRAARDARLTWARLHDQPTHHIIWEAWEAEVRVLGLDLHGLGGAA